LETDICHQAIGFHVAAIWDGSGLLV
jgi:hypothetical protein